MLGEIGNYYYGQGHPMKPHRIRMTHNLLLNYGLYRKMEIYVRTFLQSSFIITLIPFFNYCFLQRDYLIMLLEYISHLIIL